MSKDTPTYFAVPAPDTGDMTYWYRDRDGSLKTWPPKLRGRPYGPKPPDGLDDLQWRDWMLSTFRPWREKVEAVIASEPEACAARFAAFQSRCGICGKALTDEESKVIGIGPECRSRVPQQLVEFFAGEIARIHGEQERQRAALPAGLFVHVDYHDDGA